MYQIWDTYFELLGGKRNEQGHWEFGDYQKQSDAVVFASEIVISPLTQYRLIRVSGEEAAVFLQRQFSNDIQEITDSHSQYSCYSNAKGRMLASFLIWRWQGDYWLMVAADIAEAICQRLSMFILRSRVKALLSDTISLIGLKERKGQNEHDFFPLSIPDMPYQVIATDNSVMIRTPGGGGIIAANDKGTAHVCTALNGKPGVMGVGCEAWSLLDIRAGIPWVTQKTQEAFVAQMANMDLIGAVNFKKGCFPGQEIIARTQYLGKLKRRLYRVAIPGRAQVGDLLLTSLMGEQPIGMVVNVARVNDKVSEALAVIQSHVCDREIFVREINSQPVTLLPLPYPF